MDRLYKLDGDTPVPCGDAIEWARWFETADRHIANDEVGSARISTVFLGLDHSFGSGPPILYETMIFGGASDGDQERYSTREQALAGHAAMVARAKIGLQ